jgi:hypothetical protein
MRRALASRSPTLCRLSVALALGATLLTPARARAEGAPAWPCNKDPFFCETAAIKFDRVDALPIEWNFDTGWVPQNSPLAVRIEAGVYANTHVALAGALETSWPEALHLTTPGDADGGEVDFHYGAKFKAQGTFNITIAGITYAWTGDIPFVPKVDFQVQAAEPFNAWAYAPGVSLASKTLLQKVASVGLGDVIGASIPGVDGGFELDVAMEVEATYTTDRMVIATADGKVTEGGAITEADGASFTPYLSGPSIDLDVHPEGQVDYDGVLHLVPAFYITLLGKKFQIPVADVPLAFPITKTQWVFDAERVHVPLPDLALPKKIDLGEVEVGQEAIAPYKLWNAGEARVHAEVSSSEPEIFPPYEKGMDIDPSVTFDSAVRFVPDRAGTFTAKLMVASNDPSDPVQIIELTGKAYGGASAPMEPPEPTEPSLDQDSGCACRAAGRGEHPVSPGAITALAMSTLALHARRRRRRA